MEEVLSHKAGLSSVEGLGLRVSGLGFDYRVDQGPRNYGGYHLSFAESGATHMPS